MYRLPSPQPVRLRRECNLWPIDDTYGVITKHQTVHLGSDEASPRSILCGLTSHLPLLVPALTLFVLARNALFCHANSDPHPPFTLPLTSGLANPGKPVAIPPAEVVSDPPDAFRLTSPCTRPPCFSIDCLHKSQLPVTPSLFGYFDLTSAFMEANLRFNTTEYAMIDALAIIMAIDDRPCGMVPCGRP